MNKICVVGLGYIGLPTAALLANRNYKVHGVDVKQQIVDIINSGNIHIVEPELDTFVRSAVQSGNLVAGLQPVEAEVFIIAVPTPFHDGYKPNIDYVLSATDAIAPFIKKGNLVILESTSPIGTTDKIALQLASHGVDVDDIYIAHCPERVLPGHVMRELIENDRIVGGINENSTIKAAEFYENFVSGKVIRTNAKTAEMCKLVENSYRDVNIAFANELSMICDKADINVYELINLANHHPRVNILTPGVGVGGHCIAVDPWFIVSDFPNDAKIIRKAREVNDYKTEWVISQIKEKIELFEKQKGYKPVISFLGLSYKPDIDDFRESPAVHIVESFMKSGFDFSVVEPNITSHSKYRLIELEDALKSDILIKLVGHKQFQELPKEKLISFVK